MLKSNVIGMFVGTFVGDMLGAPHEFKNSLKIPDEIVPTTGGAHNVSLGEWTDDGAMTMAIAKSYIACSRFDSADIAYRFKEWARIGKYGTRNYCFDIGGTTKSAITRMSSDFPFSGRSDTYSSGNGSLMRIAGILAANHNNYSNALAESIASSLMTHGSTEIIAYTTAFVDELFHGKKECYKKYRSLFNSNDLSIDGTIMRSYNMAWWACHEARGDTAEAIRLAVKAGGDTDTNAAITGMLMGARNGIESFPEEWLDVLQKRTDIFDTAEKLYEVFN